MIANEQILYLQKEHGLAPIDDPYNYLKTIYDNFDFSTVIVIGGGITALMFVRKKKANKGA